VEEKKTEETLEAAKIEEKTSEEKEETE